MKEYWFDIIPNNWSVKKAKYLFRERNEKGNNINLEILTPSQKYGVLPQSKYQEVTGTKPVQVNEKADLSLFKTVHKNDFCISLSAYMGGFEFSNYEGVISPAYHSFYQIKENFNNNYLALLFKCSAFIDEINKITPKSVRVGRNTSFEKFSGVLMPIPPIEEQQKIQKFLNKKIFQIDKVIEKMKITIEDYKKYKRFVITEAVTKGLNNNIEIKDSNNRWIRAIPVTWNIQKLKTFIEIPVVDGPHESPELLDEGIPYISATAIENGKINFDLMRGYISEEYCNQCDIRYKPEINDILVIKLGATTGQVAIVDTNKRFNIWVPLAAVRCNLSVDPRFIYYSFQSSNTIRQMELMWTFGTQQTLGVKTIEQLVFALPSKSEQELIVKYLDKKCTEIDNLILNKEKILYELEQYKKSLIYEYVTGKKEVI